MLPISKRVLIVDDDALIRRWLSMLLSQMDEENLEILEADNGEEALRLCRAQAITLVLTDIKMPVMDGLTLIKTLKDEQPHVRTAVLSSFDDFEYVQVALRYGALDYVLKVQMQLEDIQRLMQKLRENLSFEAGMKSNARSYQVKLRQDHGNYLTFLHQDGMTDADFLSKIHPQFQVDGLSLTMMRIKASGVETPFELCSAIYSAVLSESIPCSVFPVDNNLYLMLTFPPEPFLDAQEESLRLLASVNRNLQKFANTSILQNIKVDCAKGDDLREQLSLLKELIDYQVYYAVSSVARDAVHPSASSTAMLENMRPAFESQNAEKSVELLMQFIDRCHELMVLPSRIKSAVSTLSYMMLASLLLEEQREDEHIKRLTGHIRQVENADEKKLLRQRALDFCNAFLEISRLRPRLLSSTVSDAMQYIEENSASRLTLDEVAEHVSLNSSYLSSLFSKEVGMSFVNFVEMVRIRKAKRLLLAGHQSMQEIAEAVGYANQNYFSKVFRKRTGMSPSQFQKQSLR